MLPLVIFWILGVTDIALTAILIYFNIMEEWSPVLLWFFEKGGLANMVLFKISELTLCLGFVALCAKRTWVAEKQIRMYVFAGMFVYAAIVIPAYLSPFLFK